MPAKTLPIILFTALTLSACVSTVGSVVTAPVRVVSKGADWATTSQDEADRNRGRELRKQAERDRKQCRRAGYEKRYCEDRYPD